jgi:hypothetical protein
MPDWAAPWSQARVLADLPRQWIHPSRDPEGRIRPDFYLAEDPRASRTSPHPLNDPRRPDRSVEQMAVSPYLDRLILQLALELVDAEALGRHEEGTIDLLAIGLSATDLIGHLYGPFSQESRAALADLDEALAAFLAALEARVGPGRVGVVLTADHGVLPIPEWVQEVDLPENGCPVEGGRVSAGELAGRLHAAVETRLGRDRAELGPWFVVNGAAIHANRARLEASGASKAVLDAAIRAAVETEPGIERVWSRDELAGSSAGPASHRAQTTGTSPVEAIERSDLQPPIETAETRRLLRHSLAPGRSPDWIVEPRRGCLITDRPFGTTHGSPHDYDRRIPLVFWGPGVEPGVDARAARLVDLAPTLASWLGIEVPSDVDGRVLPLTAP